jgi:His-Xaa-Ser system protein HxsD
MTSPDPAGDELVFDASLEGRDIVLLLDDQEHDKDAICAASYGFVDRCWVFLSRPSEGKVRVHLRAKTPVEEPALVAMAEELAHDLVQAGLRMRLSRATADLREQYTGRALFGGHRDGTVADLLAELDQEDLADEPLMIEVPWEKKREDDG